MDASSIPFFITACAAVALAVLIYRQRELQVRGRWILASLRAGVLLLTLFLVWNPQLPGRLAPQGAADSWVLLDRSMSMSAGEGGGAWDTARSRARELVAEGARLVTFGERVRPLPPDSLGDISPDEPATRLAAALERAAEAGARRVVVVSDLRVRDPSAAAAVLLRTRADVVLERTGGRVRNVGIPQALAPRAVQSGQDVPLEVVVQGEGGDASDSVTVEVREDGRLVASERRALPPDGRQARVNFTLPPPANEGDVRYVVTAKLAGDRFSEDDQRILWLTVGPEIRGAVLLSLRPTWEPRFVLPVLQQVTGLQARGYLRLGDGRYLVAAGGTSDRAVVSEEEVRRAMSRAELLVLHRVGRGAPDWIVEQARTASRLLVFAHDPAGAALAGVEVGTPLPGEWYPTPELPPSPLAADLSGAELTGLPPLSGVLPVLGDDAPGPLTLQRDGQGRSERALTLTQVNGRRRVTVLASGFWRWGFREGPPREAYRRLWAAVSGWLLANEAVASGMGVRPAAPVVPREQPVDWLAPGLAEDSIRLRIRAGAADVVDTVVVVPAGESFRTHRLPPGRYSFTADRGAGTDREGEGEFDVEIFTDEMLLSPAVLDSASGAGPEALRQAAAVGRPLRTYALPYVLLLVLLCGEWIGRRRLGLR